MDEGKVWRGSLPIIAAVAYVFAVGVGWVPGEVQAGLIALLVPLWLIWEAICWLRRRRR